MDDQYKKLHTFQKQHNHCNVPRELEEDKSLGMWVNAQRKMQKNKLLREDRRKRLDEIGFTWAFNGILDGQWEEKFRDLVAYQKKEGHTRVTSLGSNMSLYTWTGRQRVAYANGKLENSRRQQLDDIGFSWTTTTNIS